MDPVTDYPLAARRPDLVRTPSGLGLDELSLDSVRRGTVSSADLRATPGTLLLQAEIARAAGRVQLAENLARAAELSGVPDDVLLEVYTALRPGRTTLGELEAWAERLEREYAAPGTAAFVREAAAAYSARGLDR